MSHANVWFYMLNSRNACLPSLSTKESMSPKIRVNFLFPFNFFFIIFASNNFDLKLKEELNAIELI